MANVPVISSGTRTSGVNTYVLGNAAQGAVGSTAIQIVGNTFTGSFTVVGRIRGSSAAFVAIPYKRRNLGGTASDDTVVSAAITASAVIFVDAAGLDIALDLTANAAGTADIYFEHLIG